jgi:hypothetical protein
MGKKSGPAAPAAPDPVATAQAQGQYNKDAAITQANLNRIDQYTPQGSITYSQIGTNSDGTPKYSPDANVFARTASAVRPAEPDCAGARQYALRSRLGVSTTR